MNVNFTALMQVKVSDEIHLWAIILSTEHLDCIFFYGNPRLLD